PATSAASRSGARLRWTPTPARWFGRIRTRQDTERPAHDRPHRHLDRPSDAEALMALRAPPDASAGNRRGFSAGAEGAGVGEPQGWEVSGTRRGVDTLLAPGAHAAYVAESRQGRSHPAEICGKLAWSPAPYLQARNVRGLAGSRACLDAIAI